MLLIDQTTQATDPRCPRCQSVGTLSAGVCLYCEAQKRYKMYAKTGTETGFEGRVTLFCIVGIAFLLATAVAFNHC